mmetsp:Transcript_43049/g.101625  ORF Transcript_43049/g.101625 Transcript_43049/m.101625 type:complete len:296 (-) Transcript_43049:766-1653(-)
MSADRGARRLGPAARGRFLRRLMPWWVKSIPQALWGEPAALLDRVQGFVNRVRHLERQRSGCHLVRRRRRARRQIATLRERLRQVWHVYPALRLISRTTPPDPKRVEGRMLLGRLRRERPRLDFIGCQARGQTETLHVRPPRVCHAQRVLYQISPTTSLKGIRQWREQATCRCRMRRWGWRAPRVLSLRRSRSLRLMEPCGEAWTRRRHGRRSSTTTLRGRGSWRRWMWSICLWICTRRSTPTRRCRKSRWLVSTTSCLSGSSQITGVATARYRSRSSFRGMHRTRSSTGGWCMA